MLYLTSVNKAIMRCILLFYFLSITIFSFSQTEISAFVFSENKKPLPYCSIVLKNQHKGTYSDSTGRFNLYVEQLNSDSVIISYLGYKTLVLPIKELTLEQRDTLFLKQNNYLLKEVTVLPGKYQTIKFKANRNFPGNFLGSSNSIIAYHLNKHHGGYLKEITFYYNSGGLNVLAGIRIYKKNEIFSHEDNMLDTNLIFKLKQGSHRLKVNLQPYYLKIPSEGILIGIEFINNPSYHNKDKKYRFNVQLRYQEEEEANSYITWPGMGWKTYLGGRVKNLDLEYSVPSNPPNLRLSYKVMVEQGED